MSVPRRVDTSQKAETREDSLRVLWRERLQRPTPYVDDELLRAIRKDAELHKAYIARFQQGEAVEHILLLVNYPLMHRLVTRYVKWHRDWADLWQEARMATLAALIRFDATKNVAPYTWLFLNVRSYLRRYMIQFGQGVRFPSHLYSNKRSTDDKTKWKYGKVQLVWPRTAMFTDMDDAYGANDTTSESFQDRIVDATPNVGEILEVSQLVTKLPDLVWRLTRCLNTREREIIFARYLVDDDEEPPTLAELGRKWNLSRERMRQLEVIAFEKMREMVRVLGCHVYSGTFYEWVIKLLRAEMLAELSEQLHESKIGSSIRDFTNRANALTFEARHPHRMVSQE